MLDSDVALACLRAPHLVLVSFSVDFRREFMSVTRRSRKHRVDQIIPHHRADGRRHDVIIGGTVRLVAGSKHEELDLTHDASIMACDDDLDSELYPPIVTDLRFKDLMSYPMCDMSLEERCLCSLAVGARALAE